eukprot:CAMPEP_0170603202 /NCGR_PEP_ID=MMETSP0224-20130122/18789_1 /TAXON_ID=285029 /ORGANISM="Togula jolla, Strain CCCM 725" /LENGTH=221 /DNA_ID=CAMNT_0010928073 /DNA_START=242 /DNA_END=907 /DNA_ORIENTATION=+
MNDYTKECILAGFCLAGLPIVILGIWGTFQKIETLVRLYLYYMMAHFVVNLYFALKNLVFAGPCQQLPSILETQGRAFACGVARSASATAVSLIFLIEMYLIFVVWSYCEDIAEGGGMEIGDLAKDILGRPISQKAMRKKLRDDDPYTSLHGLGGGGGGADGESGLYHGFQSMMGLGEGQGVVGEYGSIYDTAAASGLGGSRRIFNGRYHEMQFPPPSHHN